MVVDMEMLAPDVWRDTDTPQFESNVYEYGEQQVPVRGADFVVMMRDFADADVAGAGARLVLVDVFVAQVERRTGLGDRALRMSQSAVDGNRRRNRSWRGGRCSSKHAQAAASAGNSKAV
jgi:hypothetical protein